MSAVAGRRRPRASVTAREPSRDDAAPHCETEDGLCHTPPEHRAPRPRDRNGNEHVPKDRASTIGMAVYELPVPAAVGPPLGQVLASVRRAEPVRDGRSNALPESPALEFLGHLGVLDDHAARLRGGPQVVGTEERGPSDHDRVSRGPDGLDEILVPRLRPPAVRGRNAQATLQRRVGTRFHLLQHCRQPSVLEPIVGIDEGRVLAR